MLVIGMILALVAADGLTSIGFGPGGMSMHKLNTGRSRVEPCNEYGDKVIFYLQSFQYSLAHRVKKSRDARQKNPRHCAATLFFRQEAERHSFVIMNEHSFCMPKLDEHTQSARRGRILDAAEQCFARSGFHGASMQDICREADISAGALYLYFASKDDLIAGFCERESLRFADDLGELVLAEDFLAGLEAVSNHFLNQPEHKIQLHLEIGAEAARNDKIRRTMRAADEALMERFAAVIDEVKAKGRIAPVAPTAVVTRVMAVIGDGLFWHRAVDPGFDPRVILPPLLAMISTLLNPIPLPAHKITEPQESEN